MQVALRLYITHNRPCVAPVKAPGGSVRARNVLKARGRRWKTAVGGSSARQVLHSCVDQMERSCGHSLPRTRTLLPSRFLLDSDDDYEDDNYLE